MKNLVLAVIFSLIFFAVSSIGAQKDQENDELSRNIMVQPRDEGKIIQVSSSSTSRGLFVGFFQVTINEEPVYLLSKNKDVSKKKLSDREIQLVKTGIDAIKPSNWRKIIETPDMIFTFEADGNTLWINGKSQRDNEVVIKGKFTGSFSSPKDTGLKPMEFKQNGSNIVMNDGKLSDLQVKLVELVLDGIKHFIR